MSSTGVDLCLCHTVKRNPLSSHPWLLLMEVGLLEISDSAFMGLLWMLNRNIFRMTWLLVMCSLWWLAGIPWVHSLHSATSQVEGNRWQGEIPAPQTRTTFTSRHAKIRFSVISPLWTWRHRRMQFSHSLSRAVKGKFSPLCTVCSCHPYLSYCYGSARVCVGLCCELDCWNDLG